MKLRNWEIGMLAVLMVGVFFTMALPALAVNLFGVKCDPTLAPSNASTAGGGPCNATKFLQLISAVIIKTLFVLFIVAPLMIAFGGIMVMTAAGSESRVGTGKNIIKAAVIGIAIGLGSYLIIEAIKIALNVKGGFLPGVTNNVPIE